MGYGSVGKITFFWFYELMNQNVQSLFNASIDQGLNILVVGVGAPKQEKWIMKYKSELSNVEMFMAHGGTIEFDVGNIQRAHIIFQKLYLEWLYRLFKGSKRLQKRYLIDDFPFFYLLIKKLGIYINPHTKQTSIWNDLIKKFSC